MKKVIITLSVILLAATSCLKMDFYPHNAFSRYNVGEEEMPLFYYGLYNCSQYKPTSDGYYALDIMGGDLERAGGSAGFTPAAQVQALVIPNGGFVNGPWTGYYAWLYQVNCFIESADKMTPGADRDLYLGTGHFFRGLIYYNLTSRWRSVPILRVATNEPVASSPEADCWAFVEEEFKAAIDLLGVFAGDNTYLSKQAAQALMARTCLAEGKMTEAAQYAEAVIGSGYFSLDTYENIWDKDKSSEVIFAYANTGADENGIQMSSMFRGSPSYIPTAAFEQVVLTNDERYGWLHYADGQYITFNKYNTYGGYDPIMVTRLSEMYLISAEAKGRTAGLGRLNELRTKRGLPEIGVPATDDAYIDAILAERRLELAGEGFRWFDLVRTGRYEATLGLDSRYNVLPIPEEQINRSKGVLKQNPVWSKVEE